MSNLDTPTRLRRADPAAAAAARLAEQRIAVWDAVQHNIAATPATGEQGDRGAGRYRRRLPVVGSALAAAGAVFIAIILAIHPPTGSEKKGPGGPSSPHSPAISLAIGARTLGPNPFVSVAAAPVTFTVTVTSQHGHPVTNVRFAVVLASGSFGASAGHLIGDGLVPLTAQVTKHGDSTSYVMRWIPPTSGPRSFVLITNYDVDTDGVVDWLCGLGVR